MLCKLKYFRGMLQKNVGSPQDWNSLLIDYEKPMVERLWRQEGEYRIYLHKIHPCEATPFFHSHKWPSAIHILSGSYLMGYGKSKEVGVMPEIEKILRMKAGDSYEMLTELEWHYVQPVEECSYSLMITGLPFHIEEPKSHPHLAALSKERKARLLHEFKEIGF